MVSVTYGKCYLWQKYYGKCNYGKSIMANETEPYKNGIKKKNALTLKLNPQPYLFYRETIMCYNESLIWTFSKVFWSKKMPPPPLANSKLPACQNESISLFNKTFFFPQGKCV